MQAYRLAYVDPATGAMTRGTVLARGDQTFGPWLDFDPTGRYALFGLQDTHSVSTWWFREGEPVRVTRIEIGDQVPANVAGAYVAGACRDSRRRLWGPGRPVQPTEESEGESTRRLVVPLTQ